MPILDQWGSPISSRMLDAAREDGSRPPMGTRTEGIRAAINTSDWRKVVYVSKYLYANMGVPRGAIKQKADFAIGDSWQPVHMGEKSPAVKEWASKAIDWLLGQFYPMCEVRGHAFDMVSCLNLDSVTMDREGGYGVLLTESADGFPQTQRIPIHRFGSRFDTQEQTVAEGEFKGLRIFQGIIYSPQGRPVGYRIYDEPLNTYGPSTTYEDISERDLIHNYEPDFYDQGHGMPSFTHALNDFRDLKQSKEWEQMSMLICSQIGLVEENAAGALDTSDASYRNVQTDTTKPAINTEIFDSNGVSIRYFKANSGQGLKQLVNMKPGEDWERFYDRLVRGALCGINWPSTFIWKPEGTGVDSREDILQCRTSVAKRQKVLKPVAKRIVGYAIAKAMKRGDLDPYPGQDLGGALRWDFQMPARMTVDDGREGNENRENIKAGLTTKNAVAAATLGITGEQLGDMREAEVLQLLERAERVTKAYPEVTMEYAINLLEQRSPNPPVLPTPESAPTPNPDDQ